MPGRGGSFTEANGGQVKDQAITKKNWRIPAVFQILSLHQILSSKVAPGKYLLVNVACINLGDENLVAIAEAAHESRNR